MVKETTDIAPPSHLLELVADEIEASGESNGEFFLAEVDPCRFEIDDEHADDVFPDELLDDWLDSLEPSTVKLNKLVWCSKEPRGGMLTYNYTLAGASLPSGRRLYVEWGDTVKLQGVAVARSKGSDLRFLTLREDSASRHSV